MEDKKIVMVTGATDGIGKQAALELAKRGHKVIIHGRNAQKAQAVVGEIVAACSSADVDIALCDLLSFADIKRMANELLTRYDHLDVLVNNAGAVFSKERVLTEDGQERTFQLNVLAPYLLTNLLLPLLQASDSARVVIEASGAHAAARKPDFDDMLSTKEYNAQGNYSLSKLYAIWMGQHFAKVLTEQGIENVTVNITHPGAVATKFGQDMKKGLLTDLIYKVGLLFMVKPEDGAKSEVYLAVSPEVKGVSGKFFDNKCQEAQPEKRYWTPENEQAIWDYCEKACAAHQ